MRRFLPVVLFAAFVGVSVMGLAAQEGLEPTLTPPFFLLAETDKSEEKTDIRETPFLETAIPTLPAVDEPLTLIFKTLTATQDPFVNALWTPTPIIPPTLETTFTVPALQAPFTTQIVDTFDNGPLAI